MSTDAKAAAAEVWNAGWGESQPPAQANEEEKLWGMLANVLGLFFIVGPLVAWFVKSGSKFVKFYALQMIFLHLAGLAVGIVLGVLFTVLAAVPLVGWLVVTLIGPLFSLAMLAVLVFLALKAKSGALYKLPALGAIACRTVYEAK